MGRIDDYSRLCWVEVVTVHIAVYNDGNDSIAYMDGQDEARKKSKFMYDFYGYKSIHMYGITSALMVLAIL